MAFLRMTDTAAAELRAFLRAADLTLAGLDSPAVRIWIERGPDAEIVGSTGFELSADGGRP